MPQEQQNILSLKLVAIHALVGQRVSAFAQEQFGQPPPEQPAQGQPPPQVQQQQPGGASIAQLPPVETPPGLQACAPHQAAQQAAQQAARWAAQHEAQCHDVRTSPVKRNQASSQASADEDQSMDPADSVAKSDAATDSPEHKRRMTDEAVKSLELDSAAFAASLAAAEVKGKANA